MIYAQIHKEKETNFNNKEFMFRFMVKNQFRSYADDTLLFIRKINPNRLIEILVFLLNSFPFKDQF